VYPGLGKRPEKHMEFPAGAYENSEGGFYMRFSGNFPAPVECCGSSLVYLTGVFSPPKKLKIAEGGGN
jgi:hypothetical protein